MLLCRSWKGLNYNLHALWRQAVKATLETQYMQIVLQQFDMPSHKKRFRDVFNKPQMWNKTIVETPMCDFYHPNDTYAFRTEKGTRHIHHRTNTRKKLGCAPRCTMSDSYFSSVCRRAVQRKSVFFVPPCGLLSLYSRTYMREHISKYVFSLSADTFVV